MAALIFDNKMLLPAYFSPVNKAVILLGSNLGDRLSALVEAISHISRSAGTVLSMSGVYETAPWGNTGQGAFLNRVLIIHTDLPPDQLLNHLLSIERKAGRIRVEKWEPRIIDIDILFYNDLILDEEHLTLPHPLIQERRFTLVPLNELMPDYVHPVFNKSIAMLLAECHDSQEVTLLI